jgi:hypothetical protein
MRVFPLALAACALLAADVASAQNPFTLPNSLTAPRTASAYYTRARQGEDSPSDHGQAPLPMPPAVVDEDLAPHANCEAAESCDWCGDCYQPWLYGRAAWLIMTRDGDDKFCSSFDTLTGRELLSDEDVSPHWENGLEVTVGGYLSCALALEATYWTLEPFNESATIGEPAGFINTPLNFRSLQFAGGPVNDWFDNATAHSLNRRSEFHNVELNLRYDMPLASRCQTFRLTGIAGVRFFRFSDDFLFGTADPPFGVDPATEAYYDVDIRNNLVGGQLGAQANWEAWDSFNLYVTTLVGLYNNHITQHHAIYTGLGEHALDIRTDKNDVAVLGQIDLGASYAFTQNISAYIGYRLVAGAGVAQSLEQIPYLGDDLDAIREIDSNGHLFLHGALAGFELRY